MGKPKVWPHAPSIGRKLGASRPAFLKKVAPRHPAWQKSSSTRSNVVSCGGSRGPPQMPSPYPENVYWKSARPSRSGEPSAKRKVGKGKQGWKVWDVLRHLREHGKVLSQYGSTFSRNIKFRTDKCRKPKDMNLIKIERAQDYTLVPYSKTKKKIRYKSGQYLSWT